MSAAAGTLRTAQTKTAEAELFALIGYEGLPEPICAFTGDGHQHRFHLTRRWRYDFAWPVYRVACEVQGGTWTQGGHVRGLQFARDREKMAEAQIAGWIVVEVTPNMMRSGLAMRLLNDALRVRGWSP